MPNPKEAGKVKIPKENQDIRRAIRNKIIRQCSICVLWTAAVMLVAVLTHTINEPLALILYIVVCLIPFAKMKMWRWIFDRSFEGEIIKRKTKQRVESTDPSKPTVGTLVRVYDQKLVIKQPSGKPITFTVTRREKEMGSEYREGMFVRKYYGTKHLQVITDRPSAPCICVMCGTQNDPDNAVCGVCGMSLIDSRK